MVLSFMVCDPLSYDISDILVFRMLPCSILLVSLSLGSYASVLMVEPLMVSVD